MITIVSATEKAQMSKDARKRAIMGTDFRCHGGARSIVHKRHNEYKRFGGKERREAIRGE